jgi:hypothetical protein
MTNFSPCGHPLPGSNYEVSTEHWISSDGTGTTVNSDNDTISVSISISATCVSCYFEGTAVVTTTGVKTDQSLLGDIISFLEDPIGVLVNALDLDLEVNLENLVGHFEFDVAFAVSGTYTLQIYNTETPVGIQVRAIRELSNPVKLRFILVVTKTKITCSTD